jgi:hypothetical protein
MLKSIFLVFIAGWVLWFWIDKPPPGQFGLPPAGNSMVENFQRTFDLLKAGKPAMAYLYIWHAHYLILSAVFGILAAVAYRSISDHLAMKSRRRYLYPLPGSGTSPLEKNAPRERPAVPSGNDKTPANGGSDDPSAG